MKIENWNGHSIRFIDYNGEWCAVAKDVADALAYPDSHTMTRRIPKQNLVSVKIADMNQNYTAITEFGIYKAIFGSHKPDAEAFQEWVFKVIRRLRESNGLESFQVFRMLDKQHQRNAMGRLEASLGYPQTVDRIKANVIADKAVSNMHGAPKMIKKPNMTPDMLRDRQPVLDDTVNLMGVQERFGLKISISDAIYRKYAPLKGGE